MVPRRSRSRSVLLVVEDDPSLRNWYQSVLRGAGFEVIAVEDGLDALRVIDRQIPDAIVLDVQLPRVSGHDVYAELKARPETQHVPILVVSGYDTAGFHPSDSPMVRVFTKPIDPQTLIDVIQRCVSLPRANSS